MDKDYPHPSATCADHLEAFLAQQAQAAIQHCISLHQDLKAIADAIPGTQKERVGEIASRLKSIAEDLRETLAC